MKRLALKLLLPFCLFAAQAQATGPVIAVHDAWVREAPPGTSVLAGYLKLENHGTDTVNVDAIRSRDFERIELHRTVVELGVARMLPVESLTIAPGETVSLEPGGMHLMLFSPARPLRQDDRVSFSVELADGSSHPFEATVRRDAGDDSHQHHHHH